jgi:hypothetical protein
MAKHGTKPKPKRKLSKKVQYERFLETARKLGVDETSETFEHAFRKIVPPRYRKS